MEPDELEEPEEEEGSSDPEMPLAQGARLAGVVGWLLRFASAMKSFTRLALSDRALPLSTDSCLVARRPTPAS